MFSLEHGSTVPVVIPIHTVNRTLINKFFFLLVLAAGLFEPEYESLELAFKSAIEKMNLHHVVGSGRLIVYDVQQTAQRDSFEANREGK